jgi:hypothetical protein
MMEWIALDILITFSIIQYVIYEASFGRYHMALVPVAVGVSLIGSVAAILICSSRVVAAVEEAGG